MKKGTKDKITRKYEPKKYRKLDFYGSFIKPKLNQMKKIVLVCGGIAGLIVSAMGVISTAVFCASGDFQSGMVYGYTSMIIAFSLIFVGVKNFRDKYNNGVVSFGKAFKVGILIALVASTFYVISWLINFHFFMPDFYEKYSIRILAPLAFS